MENELDLTKLIADAAEKAQAELGHVNILIAGKTGVGKSTLINAIFQGDLAETGSGRPITQEIKEITKPGSPVSIFDTKGLEMKDYKPILEELKDFVAQKRKEANVENQIHIAWLCIEQGSDRVEDAEIDLLDTLSEEVPVVVVLTKSKKFNSPFKNDVENLLPKAKNVVEVRALEEKYEDDGDVMILKQKGLDTLVEITNNNIPEGAQKAFIAAQKASINLKVKKAEAVVASASTAAAAAAAVPLPFADFLAIVPIQIGMFAGISSAFGLELSKATLGTLVSSTLGATGAAIGGRALANAIKLIPGVGALVGGLVNATVAVTITETVGNMYIGVLVALFNANNGNPPTVEQIKDAIEARKKK